MRTCTQIIFVVKSLYQVNLSTFWCDYILKNNTNNFTDSLLLKSFEMFI